jgi:hypothetical protein
MAGTINPDNLTVPTGQQSPYDAQIRVLHRGYQSEAEAKDPLGACQGRPDPGLDPIGYAEWRVERGLSRGLES